MSSNSKITFLVVLVLGVGVVALLGQAPKKSLIAYPVGYRKWAHVKSMVIFGKDHKLFTQFEGLHNIYVNDIGWPALQQGRAYADGSMFAFELFALKSSPGAIESGQRKFLAVMRKNSKLYPDTGGWGFEVFQGYQSTGSLKEMKPCFDCHAARKGRDFVFSDYAE
jgi:hypothetical protein